MLALREKLRLVKGGKNLRQLIQACPELWQETGNAINARLGALTGKGARSVDGDNLNTYIKELIAKADSWMVPLANSHWNSGMVDRAFPDLVRARMARLAMQNYYLGALAGKSGKIRFNWWNGNLLQALLFQREFERKPVSLFWYGLVWPLVSQKTILMRLVYKKGIYCFYSRFFVRELVRLIRDLVDNHQPEGGVLEVAAGDGTLTGFLRKEGLEIAACDDYSWEATAKVASPDVAKLDAVTGLKTFKPTVVICSWPPSGNQFEQEIFAAAETRMYVVIGSRHQFATGNRAAYSMATGTKEKPGKFMVEYSSKLTAAILPRELDNEVLIFRRR